MGQRLNIEVHYDGELVANAYYHWSAYTSSSLNLLGKVIEAYQNRTEINKLKVAVEILQATGAGINEEERQNIAKDVKIDSGWWLAALPRSGMGFKYRIQLDNTVGVIDEDYYGSSNEGHIFIKITNDTRENKTLCVNAGDGFMQAIFIPYGITYNDDAKAVRDGGMGSTGR